MKKKILFVDDEINVLDGLKRILHDKNNVWDMSFSTDAGGAVKLLEENSFDAAVLDISMSGENGFDILAKIKSNPGTRDIEVIVLTGHKEKTLKREALDLGATDLINKPVQKEDLIARLNSVLRIKSYSDKLKGRNILLEEQLIQSRKMETIGKLSAGVVHDLNNILTIIAGYSELTLLHFDTKPEVNKNLNQIKIASDRAKKIVEQIHNISRQKSTNYKLCNMVSIINEFLDLYQPSVPDEVEIDCKCLKTSYQIMADPTQIYQVLMNLCVNAVQAMQDSGVLRITAAETDLGANSIPTSWKIHPGKYLRLMVHDTGKGIDPESLKRIFKPSFTTKSAKGGSGLGLSVVRRIVKDHEGMITVESDQKKGTTFFIYFPLMKL